MSNISKTNRSINPERIYDHYESIYNKCAETNKLENKNYKNLYFALI
jgi:hypothetical protein